MVCANCGAELRPTARFCNQCGSALGGVATKIDDRNGRRAAVGAPTASLALPVGPDADQAPEADVAQAGSSAPQAQSAARAAANSASTSGELTAPAGRLSTARQNTPSEELSSPPAAGPRAAVGKMDERPPEIDEADTQGDLRVSQLSAATTPVRNAQSAPQQDSVVAARTSGGPAGQVSDALPWPLPATIIMDGRYRVEGVLATSEAENTYRVSDLRGYEHCWACGRDYGPNAAIDRFCRECGADMLGREFHMRERHLEDGETPESAVASGAAGVAGTPSAGPDAPRTFVQSGRAYRVEPKVTQSAAFPLGARLVAGAATDLGRRRSGELNEDSACVLILDRVHENQTQPFGFFTVADGLGGHASGQRASRLVVNVMAHTILRQAALPLVGMPSGTAVDETALADVLQDAVKGANRSLCAANQETGLNAGSTVVAALVHGETAYIANAGDSRAYVCDAEGLRRITFDHSLVQQLVAGGLIEPDEVYTHPQRNQIFRSLGDEPDLTVDLFVQQLKPGLRLLLCSDGLWEMVRDPQIEQLLRAAADPQAACDALVAAANDGGGDDNITAVVIEVR
jgi:serine/threonine protein phosphatase PrpC